MSDEDDDSPNRLRLFIIGLRLLFDALMLVVVLGLIGFIVFVTGLERDQRDPERTADGITVLTGGRSRIDEAMRLLAHGKAKRVLITGVNRATTKEELKDLASQGDQLFDRNVDIDREARNTIDNASETSEWVAQHRYSSVIVVTSNYHMPRALAELGRAMPGVTLLPYSVVDPNVRLERWWTYPGTTKLLLSEYLKYLPALGRLGATQLMRRILTGGNTVAAEDAPEP
ncbi:MAG: YdcF family protein [Methyloceanibacter sp.]